ncbi:flagellar hook-associated protein FlgK [Thiobacillus sedimenti]|uniref:Flagellar hook-associated protein 1 n=1 Tax=Thiobacillus sedimenti TaxID=3110231 RepID=A0ABZ1CMG5_9PROT|nr:flagellar hook-associated protein FlgK [Thiobacillus sp. SCUT-2]WRS40235.1 flagellar hook-associated protein FlgK [Thiobacillus sp. SCUT-2]
MATNILSIGQSALAAAQVGISVTGHNIANAATPGYSRQVVIQGAALAQNFGFGFIGQGAEISSIQRVYNEYLATQVQTSQASKSSLDAHYTQIQQIDNMLADPQAGLSPALQDFFSGVQAMASNPASIPARQATLSSADALVARFQSLAGRLDEINQGVNSQVQSSVTAINSYAQQIATLNDAISKAQRATGQPPNDLLDQRDQLVLDLNKEIKATVVKQGDGGYNIFIGNGQPLVVGNSTTRLVNVTSPTDPQKIEVAYQASNGSTVIVGDSGFAGGRLGGLIEFRSNTLEPAQNALGRVAIGLASTVNAQHRLGQDLNGALGGDLFTLPTPVVNASANNASTATVTASISNANALTTSDYQLKYDGSQYTLTRLSDNTTSTFAGLPQTVDGVTLNISTTPAAGDTFLIRPTANGASGLALAITDPTKLAAAAPIRTAAGANSGSGTISAGAVDSTYPASPLAAPVTLTYSTGTPDVLNVSPATAVTVTSGGTSTTYPAGTPVPYTAGATYSFGGVSFTLSGAPNNLDTFTVGPNTGGVGDNRNALLLADLQTAHTLGNGTATYQDAYAQLVSDIGNKTRELDVTSSAAGKMLASATQSVQNESGVNLDEEAANLLRYQQAYQAAGKVMQIASQLFNVLLTIGQ